MAIGFIAGLIFPAITWVMVELLFKSYASTFNKPGVPYLISIAVNLFIIRYFFKRGQDQSGIGAILCTFIVMALVFLFKMGHPA